ncbi:MAG TPA: formylglycine-generating enzyme family protein [Pirellulales bacterium]|nr:formylglycine-generating enzyme family protein [Pirellulales bacterium]
MHSRETPADLLADLDSAVDEVQPPPDARDRSVAAREPELGDRLTNSIGMRFVGIPRGTFTMGVKDRGNSLRPPPGCPPHEVTITRGFWLGECEATQGQFQEIMGRNPSAYSAAARAAESANDFPVEQVTWHDAVAFCERLSDREQEKAAGRSYRLPTEAEWEYACRSGTSEPYTWSAQRAADDNSGDAAGIEPPLPVTKVGSYRPNSLGLYDMRGNVWEWCGDWFDRTYYLCSPKSDPQGPATGYLKVVRGGDWIFVGEICPINYPIMSPSQASPFVGFRVVCEVSSDE